MRYGLILVAIMLVGCRSARPPEPDPTSDPATTTRPAAGPSLALTIKPLTAGDPSKITVEVVKAVDAALREELVATGRYAPDALGAKLVLTPVLKRFTAREIGAGSSFTMRDLGLDPGPEYVIANVELEAVLSMSGEDTPVAVDRQVRGGDATPGVSRQDLDGDGRSELAVTIEGVVALIRPALVELAEKVGEITHPRPETPPEDKTPEDKAPADKKPE